MRKYMKCDSRGISRHQFLRSATARATLLGLSPGMAVKSFGQDSPLNGVRGTRPNIIFILADDMGYNDVSIMGQKREPGCVPAIWRVMSFAKDWKSVA